ncbi:MAG: YceI family protein [Rhodocyclaceae bacterium]|nr:YceI family protein [Rhodocyclaceae bacterium]
MTRRILALLATTFLPLHAHAVEYSQVQSAQSAIRFTYQQMGVAVDGHFQRFSSQLSFDPARPTAAKANFTIDLASIDTGAPEGDEAVAGKPWFHTQAFPTARFVSGPIKALGNHRYEISGQLTLKGKTQEIVIPTTFTPQGRDGVFDGQVTIRRADFAVGEGSWAKFDLVANDVLIKFRITASSK